MKKIASLTLAILLCLGLASCGNATISGDPVAYSNEGNSFTIELPTSDEDDWTVNEDTSKDVLDISDNKELINIQVECLSKSKAEHIALDLAGFQDYIMVNTLADIAGEMNLKEATFDVPEFITDSIAQSFTLKSGNTNVKGGLIFMESSSCYYLYMITAVDKAYDANKKAFEESIMSLKES